jgi:hypothetical protein
MSKMIKRNFVSRATHLLGTAVRETGQAMDRLGLKIVGNGNSGGYKSFIDY